MPGKIGARAVATALFGLALGGALPAQALETIAVGAVGSPNAVIWPEYIAEAKGFYEAAGFKVDLVYSQSNALVLQALTAGSTKLAVAAGFADPINAVQHGAAIAVVRIDGQVGPYALMAKPGYKSIRDLKGKVVSLDEAKGTTMVYFVKMLQAAGMQHDDVQYIYAGATAARFAALKAGAAEAAMITAPQLFTAEGAGFANLGFDTAAAPDIPFTGDLANRQWAEANPAKLHKFLGAYDKAIAWFYDKKNRAEAVDILVKVGHLDKGDLEKSYDLFQRLNYFDRSDTVDLKKIGNFYRGLKELDPSVSLDLAKLVMPDVSKVTR